MRELTRGHGPWPAVHRSGDKEMFPVSASPGLHLVEYTKHNVDLSYFVAAQVVQCAVIATNTKDESNTETSVNSNASNNIERQRRETEKKNKSASGTIRTQYNGKKDQNKSQKIVILGDSIIKNIKGWEISRKLQNANAYVRHFLGTLHERLFEAVFKRKPRSFCSSCWHK